jgi:predicted TPR repeat methyltransferase
MIGGIARAERWEEFSMSSNNDPCDSYAERYDRQRVEYAWYGSEVLFGLMYRYLKSGEALLDLGIGTGSGTVLFQKAGLTISGLDNSPSMLEQCRKKNLGFHLTEHNLMDTPWPYGDRSFHHVFSTGVFHFIGDLRSIFVEVARVIRQGGTFGFDIYEYTPETAGEYERASSGVYTHYDTEYSVRLFRHSMKYLRDIVENTGFELLHDCEFLAWRERRQYFCSLVVRRK